MTMYISPLSTRILSPCLQPKQIESLRNFKPKSVIRACLDFDFLEGWILFGF